MKIRRLFAAPRRFRLPGRKGYVNHLLKVFEAAVANPYGRVRRKSWQYPGSDGDLGHQQQTERMAKGPSIKAVNLSEVRQKKRSAEQESLNALEQSLDQELKAKASRSNLWIGVVAAVASLYWAGGVGAYVWGRYSTGSLEASLGWWLLILTILVLPIILIWLTSLIAKRSQDLKAEANHLAAIALRLTHPEDQASREITRLGHAVRRQVEAMEKEMDLALARVSQLDNTVRDQAKTLNKTTEDAQTRIDTIKAGLQSERESLEALAGQIETQSHALAQQIESKTESLKTATEAVSETLSATDADLQTRLDVIQKTSDEAVERARVTADDLNRQIENLDKASRFAVSQSEMASGFYKQHLEALGKSTHLLAEEGRSLEAKSRDHQNTLAAMTTEVQQKVESIELGLQNSSHQIQSALSDAKSTAEQIGEDFIRKAEDRTRKIESTVSESAAMIESTLDSLESQAGQITGKIASQIEDTAVAVEGAITETANKFEGRLIDAEDKINTASKGFESSALAIEQQSQDAIRALTSAGETADTVASRAKDVLRESATNFKDDVEFSVALFSDALEQLTSQNTRLKTAFESQDEMLSQMPALVAEQVKAIESLVSDSANKVQNAVQATLDDAEQLDDKIADHARSLLTNGEDVLRALNAGLERTRQEAEEARTALTARTATIVSEIEAAGAAADEVIQKTETALLKRADSLKQLMSESDTHAETVTKAIEAKLAAGLLDVKGEIDQAESAIDDAVQRLANTSHQIEDATQAANAILENSIGRMEERFRQFPEQAKDSGERIRSIVLTQISSLTDISEEAANRVLNLDAAFQARIRGIYETLARLLPPAETQDGPAPSFDAPQALSDALAPPKLQPISAEQRESLESTGAKRSTDEKGEDIYPQIWEGMVDDKGDQDRKATAAKTDKDAPSLQDAGLAKRLARRLKKDRSRKLSLESSGKTGEPTATKAEKGDTNGSSDKTGALENALRDALKSELGPGSKKAKKMKWREILSAADSVGESDGHAFTTNTPSISRTTDHMVETLHAMTVDLSRALEKDVPAGLVDRYLAGEKDLFAKRLANLSRDKLDSTIKDKYKSDDDFRNYVDRYISQFDRLETELKKNKATPAEAISGESETRKVYELLKNAIA